MIYQILKPWGARATPSAYVIFMCYYTEGGNETVNHFSQNTGDIHIVIHREAPDILGSHGTCTYLNATC